MKIGNMLIFVSVMQGLLEILEMGGFIIGYYADIRWLLMTGGVLMVLDEVYQLLTGILNPWLPAMLIIALGLLIDPWYVGIFAALALLKLLDMPMALVKIFAPHRAISRVMQQRPPNGPF